MEKKKHIGNHKCNLTRSELFSYDNRSECVPSATWHLTEEEEEEEEDGKAEQSTLETRPLSQEDESVDSLNPEVKVKI